MSTFENEKKIGYFLDKSKFGKSLIGKKICIKKLLSSVLKYREKHNINFWKCIFFGFLSLKIYFLEEGFLSPKNRTLKFFLNFSFDIFRKSISSTLNNRYETANNKFLKAQNIGLNIWIEKKKAVGRTKVPRLGFSPPLNEAKIFFIIFFLTPSPKTHSGK